MFAHNNLLRLFFRLIWVVRVKITNQKFKYSGVLVCLPKLVERTSQNPDLFNSRLRRLGNKIYLLGQINNFIYFFFFKEDNNRKQHKDGNER